MAVGETTFIDQDRPFFGGFVQNRIWMACLGLGLAIQNEPTATPNSTRVGPRASAQRNSDSGPASSVCKADLREAVCALGVKDYTKIGTR